MALQWSLSIVWVWMGDEKYLALKFMLSFWSNNYFEDQVIFSLWFQSMNKALQYKMEKHKRKKKACYSSEDKTQR